ncbi:MAG: NosD domain-containing protein, partial [Candidatus Thermoplasmatota archaeon]
MSRISLSFALGIIFLLLVSTSVSAIGSDSAHQEIGLDEEETPVNLSDKEDKEMTERKRKGTTFADTDDIERKPIRIDNNSDFADQAEENNWTGNGSEENPYILEEFKIDGGGFGYGIYVGNVSHHFVVQECTLKNSSGRNGEYFKNSGVYIYNTSHGHLEGNTITNNSIGVLLTDSEENMIVVNEIVNNTIGMNITNSSNNVLEDNQVVENEQTGITLTLSHSNEITMNNVSSNLGKGVYLDECINNSIRNLRSMGNDKAGLELQSSDFNQIENNNISFNSGDGLYIVYSNNNVVNLTEVLSNGNHGIFLNNSENNKIYHNNFIDNDIQARDNGLYNDWTNGYPDGGNYWSDHDGDDNQSGGNQGLPGSDGIIDSPYQGIGGGTGAQDDYPLMRTMPTPHVRIESPAEGTMFSSSNITVEWSPIYRFTDRLTFEARIDQREWIY